MNLHKYKTFLGTYLYVCMFLYFVKQVLKFWFSFMPKVSKLKFRNIWPLRNLSV